MIGLKALRNFWKRESLYKFWIDPLDAAKEKLIIKEKKYPVEVVKGKVEKYDEY